MLHKTCEQCVIQADNIQVDVNMIVLNNINIAKRLED